MDNVKHMGDLMKDQISNLMLVFMWLFGVKRNGTQYVVKVLKIKQIL